MMVSLIIVTAIFLLLLLPFFLRSLIVRARKKRALKGAAFWLTSTFLCLIFAVFGVVWGLLKLFT